LREPRPDPDFLAELAARARGGEPEAFRELVRRCYGQLQRWALGRTDGDPDEADEVVQAVLIRMHRGLGEFRGESRFTSWLYRITANAAEELRRTRVRRARLLEARLSGEGSAGGAGGGGGRGAIGGGAVGWAEPISPSELDRARLTQVVLTRFRELPERQREVFDLVDLQGYAPVEVAEMLGLEPVTVRTNLLRARRAIRGKIMESHPELVEEYRG
jgi:RNA polymerase sigma-70 factor (ECF subfamily)